MACLQKLYDVERSIRHAIKVAPATNTNSIAALGLELAGGNHRGYTGWWAKNGIPMTREPSHFNYATLHEGVDLDVNDLSVVKEWQVEQLGTAKREAITACTGIYRELAKLCEGGTRQCDLSKLSGMREYEDIRRTGTDMKPEDHKDWLVKTYAESAATLGILQRVKKGNAVMFTTTSAVDDEKVAEAMGVDGAAALELLTRPAGRSLGEATVSIVLQEIKFRFTTEWWTPELRDVRPLRFDFRVFTGKPECPEILIEVQGRQHFHWTRHFHATEEEFARLQEHDRMKREFATEHNIPLLALVVPDSTKGTKQYIRREIQKAIKGATN
jgi:hypothetical protein